MSCSNFYWTVCPSSQMYLKLIFSLLLLLSLSFSSSSFPSSSPTVSTLSSSSSHHSLRVNGRKCVIFLYIFICVKGLLHMFCWVFCCTILGIFFTFLALFLLSSGLYVKQTARNGFDTKNLTAVVHVEAAVSIILSRGLNRESISWVLHLLR